MEIASLANTAKDTARPSRTVGGPAALATPREAKISDCTRIDLLVVAQLVDLVQRESA